MHMSQKSFWKSLEREFYTLTLSFFLHIYFTFININITVILVTKNSVFLYIKSNIIRNMLIIGGFCLT